MAQQRKRSKRDPGDEVATHERELAEYLQERIKPGLNRGAIPLLARSIAKEILEREHPDGEPEDAEADDQPAGEVDDDAEAAADDVEEPEDAGAEDDDEAADEAEVEDDDEDADEAEAEDDYDDEQDVEAEDEDEDESDVEADDEDEDGDESDDDTEDEDSEKSALWQDFEAEMHRLQAELGDDWILRFSVQGDDAWLTAETSDGSQHLEAPTAAVLREAVDLLDEGDDRLS
jgi:hypothetical protein